MANDDRPDGAKPSVCWFAPLQLLRTGRQVALATMFGRHGGARAIEAVTPPDAAGGSGVPSGDAPCHDYAHASAPFWFDYVADTGDGWDATATVAFHLAQPTLTLPGPGKAAGVTTERGSLLVFGGDTIYPTPSLQTYGERLLLPFRTAFPAPTEEPSLKDDPPGPTGNLRRRPDVYAIPGNHDWYDGLVAFTRQFASKSGFAGWRAPQRRSYFAIRLPAGWWLLGTDLQLGSDIDAQQEAFFRDLAARMDAADRIVVCHAEPHWLYEALNPNPYAYDGVHRLEERSGDRIKIFLSGECTTTPATRPRTAGKRSWPAAAAPFST